MKYKILLLGKNNTIIDEFFDHMKVSFDMITSSMRYEDMNAHMDLLQPDIVVYCLYNETKDEINKISELKRKIKFHKSVFVIVGAKEDCDEYLKKSFFQPDLVLAKPLTAEMIQFRIVSYMEEKEEEERRKREEERLRVEQEREELARKREEMERMAERFRRKHVLVIDDDPMMLKIIKEHLHEKYDVATAISGKIAFKFLENKSTDIILLDYEMPVQTGPEVLEKLRENEQWKDIPVLFLTGITEKDKIQKALILKPQGYLLKPIEKDKLMDTIENLIG